MRNEILPGAVPAVETERLLLRGPRGDDLDASAAMWADPQVTRYIGGIPLSREAVWTRLLRYVGHWAVMGFGYWIIEEKATGAFVGEIGFADYKRAIEPPLGSAPELGWALASPAQGRGFGTEAVGAALAWGTARFGARRTVCLIEPANLRSLRLAQKFGYRERGRTIYHGAPLIILDRDGG